MKYLKVKPNDKYGELTVLRKSLDRLNGGIAWICTCSCGKETIVRDNHLKNGHTSSCGCLRIKKIVEMSTTHGMKHTKIYRVWKDIKQRCNNPKSIGYKNYGGRGINVCKEWENSFETFYADMGSTYKENLDIDRINNELGYSKDNCHWITHKLNTNNTRRSRLLTYNNKTQTIKQWSEEMGINYNTLFGRINKSNWSTEKALTYKGEQL